MQQEQYSPVALSNIGLGRSSYTYSLNNIAFCIATVECSADVPDTVIQLCKEWPFRLDEILAVPLDESCLCNANCS